MRASSPMCRLSTFRGGRDRPRRASWRRWRGSAAWAGQDLYHRFWRRGASMRRAMPAWLPSATAPSTRMYVEPDAVGVLPKIVWHYGEPFADPSAIPTYYVSEMARRKVTVALNGDGGDEAFLGYSRYRAMRHLERLDRSAAVGPPGAGAALGRMSRTSLQREVICCRRFLIDVLEASAAQDMPSSAMPARSCFSPIVTRRPATAMPCGLSSGIRRSICWRPILRRRAGLSPAPTGRISIPTCPTI